MEHAASERLVDRIDAYLGYPAVDPHGDPDPPRRWIARRDPRNPACRCQPGQRFRVVRVMDQDPAFLRYLSECGLELTCHRRSHREPAGVRRARLPAGRTKRRTRPGRRRQGARQSMNQCDPLLYSSRYAMVAYSRPASFMPCFRSSGPSVEAERLRDQAEADGRAPGRRRAPRSPARAANRRACGRWRRSGSRARGPCRCRAWCRCFPAAGRPRSPRLRPDSRPGKAARPASSKSRAASAVGSRVETDVFLGGPDQHPAVIARDEIVLAVLDNPADQRLLRLAGARSAP